MSLTWHAIESRATRGERLWLLRDSDNPLISSRRKLVGGRRSSGWFGLLVVDQLYRKYLVNFVSTTKRNDGGHCTRNHWPVSLVTVYYLYAQPDQTMRPGNNGDTDDTHESNIENVRQASFQSDRSVVECSLFSSLSLSLSIFLSHSVVGNISYPCSPILDCLNVARLFPKGLTYTRYFCSSKATFYRRARVILASKRGFEEDPDLRWKESSDCREGLEALGNESENEYGKNYAISLEKDTKSVGVQRA